MAWYCRAWHGRDIVLHGMAEVWYGMVGIWYGMSGWGMV